MKSNINLPGFAADLPISPIIPARMRARSGIDVLLCINSCRNQWSACMATWNEIGFKNLWTETYCNQQAADCTSRCRNDNFGGWGQGSLA